MHKGEYKILSADGEQYNYKNIDGFESYFLKFHSFKEFFYCVKTFSTVICYEAKLFTAFAVTAFFSFKTSVTMSVRML